MCSLIKTLVFSSLTRYCLNVSLTRICPNSKVTGPSKTSWSRPYSCNHKSTSVTSPSLINQGRKALINFLSTRKHAWAAPSTTCTWAISSSWHRRACWHRSAWCVVLRAMLFCRRKNTLSSWKNMRIGACACTLSANNFRPISTSLLSSWMTQSVKLGHAPTVKLASWLAKWKKAVKWSTTTDSKWV